MTDEQREVVEHQNVILAIREILVTKSGKEFFKYLFKNLGVGDLPEQGLEGAWLMDQLGFLRAGQSIFQLVSEANAEVAGTTLAKIREEEHARIKQERQPNADE